MSQQTTFLSLAILDKGYDSDPVRAYVNQLGGVAVIPPKANRATKPAFDEHLYPERHRIENLSARLKSNRRIATRYEKLHVTFAAMSPPWSPSPASWSGPNPSRYLQDTA